VNKARHGSHPFFAGETYRTTVRWIIPDEVLECQTPHNWHYFNNVRENTTPTREPFPVIAEPG
jgi:hypothetical protein